MPLHSLTRWLFLLVVGLTASAEARAGGNPLLVLHTTSRELSIRDGRHWLPHVWHVDPAAQPDCYYPELPRSPHRVVFVSDQDSLVLAVRYGQTVDFVVVLNGRDSCLTRLVATETGRSPYHRLHAHAATVPDTLPFTLRGSRLYLSGQLNGQPVRVQLDLGAGLGCVSERAVARTRVHFDGQTILRNSDGQAAAPTSSRNRLTIGSVSWEQVPLVETRNMGRDEDLIIGNSLFQDKVLALDYDHHHLLVYDTLPRLGAGYSRHPVVYEQHRPLVQVRVTLARQPYTAWLLFDTGRDGAMVLRNDFFQQHPGSWAQLRTLLPLGRRRVAVVPQVELGALTFRQVVCPAFAPDGPEQGSASLLGNELLNHFNAVLDNQQGFLYLTPNHRQQYPHADWPALRHKLLLSGLALAAVLTGGWYGWYRRRGRTA